MMSRYLSSVILLCLFVPTTAFGATFRIVSATYADGKATFEFAARFRPNEVGELTLTSPSHSDQILDSLIHSLPVKIDKQLDQEGHTTKINFTMASQVATTATISFSRDIVPHEFEFAYQLDVDNHTLNAVAKITDKSASRLSWANTTVKHSDKIGQLSFATDGMSAGATMSVKSITLDNYPVFLDPVKDYSQTGSARFGTLDDRAYKVRSIKNRSPHAINLPAGPVVVFQNKRALFTRVLPDGLPGHEDRDLHFTEDTNLVVTRRVALPSVHGNILTVPLWDGAAYTITNRISECIHVRLASTSVTDIHINANSHADVDLPKARRRNPIQLSQWTIDGSRLDELQSILEAIQVANVPNDEEKIKSAITLYIELENERTRIVELTTLSREREATLAKAIVDNADAALLSTINAGKTKFDSDKLEAEKNEQLLLSKLTKLLVPAKRDP